MVKTAQRVELADHVFGSPPSTGREWFLKSCQRSRRFQLFIDRYKTKVRKKIRTAASDDDRYDVLAELEVSFLLLRGFRYPLDYEHFGQGTARAPDLTMRLGAATKTHFEVKRIRESAYEQDVDQWANTIAAAIRAIPSDLAVTLECHSIEEPFALLAHLQGMTLQTINFARSLIPSRSRQVGGPERHEVPGSGGRLSLLLTRRPPDHTARQTVFGGQMFPIGFTQKEHYKFGDAICEKLGQLRLNDANVLMITTGNLTHDDFDLCNAVASLDDLTRSGADAFFVRKGFGSAADFGSQLGALGAVWFRSQYVGSSGPRNAVWINPGARVTVPADIARRLETLD